MISCFPMISSHFSLKRKRSRLSLFLCVLSSASQYQSYKCLTSLTAGGIIPQILKKKNQPPTTNYSTCSKHRIWKQKEVKTRANIRLKLTCILGKRLSEPWNPPLQLLISNGFLLKIHSLFNSHFSNHIDIKYIYGDLFTSLFKDTQRIVHRELEVFSTWKRIPLKSEW